MLLVRFYAAVARSLAIPVPFAHLAVLVPVSFVVQMLPVSVNGLGVREAVFSRLLRAPRPPARVGAAAVVPRRRPRPALLRDRRRRVPAAAR